MAFSGEHGPVRVKRTRQDKAPNFDLVIFDCDGVLVDSEVISCRVHADVLTRHGYPITAEQVHRRFLGRTARDATAEIERELGRPLPESYDLERRTTLLAALADTVEAIPYLHAALDAIDARICVASSAAHDKIFTTLSRTGLYQRFAPHIFSGSQVSHGKPAPDLFLFAAGSNGGASPAVRGDRGQRSRRDRRAGRRDDRARLSWRQPLPAGRRRGASRGRGGGDVRRYAAIAGDD